MTAPNRNVIVAAMAEKSPPPLPAEQRKRRVSGVGGKNLQKGILLREEHEGQIDSWRAAAARSNESVSAWARRVLDAATER